MSELQGAVAVAQLEKLDSVVSDRIKMAARLRAKLDGLKGIESPLVGSKSVHSTGSFAFESKRRDFRRAVAMARLLKEKGIASAPRYIQKPAFMCEVFQKQRTFGSSNYPFNLASLEAPDQAQAVPGRLGSVVRRDW